MENISTSKRSDIANNQAVKPDFHEMKLSFDKSVRNPIFDTLAAENCETYFHYIDWLGLSKDPNVMILSSVHHYYYDYNDLKGVKTLINLRALNRIKNLNGFLHTLFRLLPPGASFVGCFEEDKNPKGVPSSFYKSAKLFNEIINFLDSRTEREMKRNEVVKLLESHGYRVADMTEINGITYFKSINTRGCGA